MTDNGARALAEEIERACRDHNAECWFRSSPEGGARAILAHGAAFLPDGLRDWQRDLLTPDSDGRTFDQVVAGLLGVKNVKLRDGQWRVEYFGGVDGGTVDEVQASLRAVPDAAELDRLRLIEAMATVLIAKHKRYGIWRLPDEFRHLAAALQPEGSAGTHKHDPVYQASIPHTNAWCNVCGFAPLPLEGARPLPATEGSARDGG